MEAMVGIWQGREDSRCLGMLWGLLLFFKLSPWEPKQSSRWGKNDLRHFFFFSHKKDTVNAAASGMPTTSWLRLTQDGMQDEGCF